MAGYDNPGGSLLSGRQPVTTGGTRVQLTTTSTAILSVIVTAETDNTGVITVGGSDVVAALSTRKGHPLQAGESVELGVNDLAKVYIDTTVNTDGVTYLAVLA